MSIATGVLSLACGKCRTQYDFPDKDAEFDVVEINERPMGPDKHHAWHTEFNCDKCKNSIELEYDVWEYPEGGFETDDLVITGGNEISRYTYDFLLILNNLSALICFGLVKIYVVNFYLIRSPSYANRGKSL